MNENIELVVNVVSELAKLGITTVAKPNNFCTYRGAWGSISNYTKVTVGRIREMHDPLGNHRLGVFVKYEALRESGEDFCDSQVTESRNVPLEALIPYLEQHGIKSPKKAHTEDRVCRINT